ncbi:MAG: hypothetical protein ABSE46_18720 [Terracidiphilus sp.]|jgi:hypothetical protein
MEPSNHAVLAPKSRRTVKEVLLSYFYWTYPRGSFHYDIMVTLILIFIGATPFFWNYGDKPSPNGGPQHPIQVVGNDDHGFIVTVSALDVTVPAGAADAVVKKILRKAIEPVTGDAVFVERWETVTDSQGNAAWKIWAHR